MTRSRVGRLLRRGGLLIASAILTLVAALLICAALVRLAPGTGSDVRELDPRLSAQSVRAIQAANPRSSYWGTVIAFGTRALHGDLGDSQSLQRPVRELIAERLSITAKPLFGGILIGWAAAVAMALLNRFRASLLRDSLRAACALLRNSRTTDSLRAAAGEEFLNGLAPRYAACALLRNSRTTDSLRAAAGEEFLNGLAPRYAACALLRNSRTTDSLRAAAGEEFLNGLAPRYAACALLPNITRGFSVLVLCIPAPVIALALLARGSSPDLAALWVGTVVALIVFPRILFLTEEVLSAGFRAPHVEYARHKGLGGGRLLFAHVIWPAAPSLLAIGGSSVGVALSGVMPVEVVCDSPGLGQLAWLATQQRDLPLLLAVTIFVTLAAVVASSFSDMARAFAAPERC